ncbi:MAG TPA: globin family protein [Afipia sp.]
MTPHQVDLVQTSFEKVAPHTELAAKMFYGRLFEIAPQVKPMFKNDMTEQGRKLMTALALVVNGLTNLDAVVPVAKKLAVGHLSYGVKADHYQPVGEALLWTLEQALGKDFDGETKEAWTSAYTTLAQVMISEAYGQPVAS